MRRRGESHDAAVHDGMTPAEWHGADVAECRRALKREVAAVRRLDLDDDERAWRIEMVREQIKTEISDVQGDYERATR